MSEYTVTYSYSRPQIRRFFRHELWRTQGGMFLAGPVVAGVVALGSLDQRYWWIAGFFAGAYLMYLIVVYAGYRRLDAFPAGEPMTTTFSEAGIHFESALLVSDVPWSSIRRARRSVDGLVLASRTTQRPVLIPSAVLSEEIILFVERKCGRTPGVGNGDPG